MSSLYRNRDYKLLIAGQVASDLGTWIAQLAYPLIFLHVTGSPLQAGLSIAVSNLPTFLFGLPAGVILDRYDRKKVMIICDLLRFLILGSIPVALAFNSLTLTHLYLAAFLTGTCDVVFATAVQSAISRVVPREQITKAFGQYEAIVNASSLIGPAIGGILYQISRGLPFLADALSFALSTLSLLFIKSDFQETKRERKPLRLHDLTEGASCLWRHPTVRPITIARAIGALVSGGQMLLLILLAERFGATPATIGLIVSVSSIGVVLGSLVSDTLQQRFGTYRMLMVARWLIAAAMPLQFFSPTITLLAISVGLSYGFVAIYGTIATGYRLTQVPDELQGRVNSFHRMLAFGGLTVGGAITGLLIETIELRATYILYTLLLAILGVFLTRQLGLETTTTKQI